MNLLCVLDSYDQKQSLERCKKIQIQTTTIAKPTNNSNSKQLNTQTYIAQIYKQVHARAHTDTHTDTHTHTVHRAIIHNRSETL